MRVVAGLFGIAAALLLIAAAAAYAALQLLPVRERILAAANAALAGGETRVRIEGLDGDLPFAPTLDAIEIADSSGVWLTIEGLDLEISPLPLLRRLLRVDSLHARRITVARLPETQGEPFRLRPRRLIVNVSALSVDELLLGKDLTANETGPQWATAIAVSAEGAMDLRRLTLDVSLAAVAPRLGDFLGDLGVDAAEAKVGVEVRGAIEAPSADLTLTVAQIGYADSRAERLELQAQARRMGRGERRYSVALAGALRGFSATEAIQALVGNEPQMSVAVSFGASPRIFDIESFSLTTATFAADLAANGKESGDIDVARLAVTWPDVSQVPGMEAVASGGALRVSGAGSIGPPVAGKFPQLRADIVVEALDTDLRDPRLAALIGKKFTAAAKLASSDGKLWSMQQAKMRARGFHADGNAEIDSATRKVSAEMAFSLPELAELAEPVGARLSGTLEGRMVVGGSLDELEATLHVQPRSLRVGRLDQIGGEVVITARRLPAHTRGLVEARLEVAGLPVRVDVRASHDDHAVAAVLSELSAKLPAATLQARGELAIDPLLFSGHVEAESADLATVSRLLGVAVEGGLNFDADFAHDGNSQSLSFSLDANAIRVFNVLPEPLSADSIGLLVTREGGTARFSLDAMGDYRGGVRVLAKGWQQGSLENGELVIEQLTGTVRGHAIRNTRPVTVLSRHGGLTIGDLAVTVGDGTLEGSLGPLDKNVAGSLRAVDLPLDLARFAFDTPSLVGLLSIEAARQEPRGEVMIKARTRNAAVSGPAAGREEHDFALGLEASVGQRRTRFDLTLESSRDGSALRTTAELPVGVDSMDFSRPLQGRVVGTLAADLLDELVLPESEHVTGQVDLDLTLAGTLADPSFRGRASGRLRYVSAVTGMDLRVDSIELAAESARVRIDALRGTDAKKGRFEGQGHFDFARNGAPSRTDIRISFIDVYLADVDELRLRGDGWLGLTGVGSALTVSGVFTADEATLRIPDRIPAEVVTLPVEHVNASLARTPVGELEAGDVPIPIALDLTIEFPERLRIEDPNLDSEWRGTLLVRGDTAGPEIHGALKVVRGTFALGGVRFRATDGQFSFDRERDLPEVDVSAVAERNGIEATLRLHGPIDAPTIDLTSNPPLPEDEILARLMFGASAGKLTPGQSLQLAQAAARLSGAAPGGRLMYRLRRYAGVDRIEIKDTGEAGGAGTALSVGKYVHDRVYVSYDQAVQGEGSKARVEVEMTKHWSAETEIGQSDAARVGLRWRWNY